MSKVLLSLVVVALSYCLASANPRQAQTLLPACLMPKDMGICRGAFPRYYFNSESGRCEQFYYGGCEGNFNNFMTMEKCVEACSMYIRYNNQCKLPDSPFVCFGYFNRYVFNHHTNQCEYVVYGGCGATDGVNIFYTEDECKQTCK